ncbi:hypothetical protein ACIBH1_45605 [Nonomuraea sp. NPDC050663]|uniref:hypothetical protein n=1 Tax=Nonomuraea sp. NPDC050663 TaxID=3364370 RepID=UPI00378D976B
MGDAPDLIHHQVAPLTLGQLRELTRDLPDNLIVTVVPSVGPGRPGDQEQAVTHVGPEYGGAPQGRLTLLADWPPGDYHRAPQ